MIARGRAIDVQQGIPEHHPGAEAFLRRGIPVIVQRLRLACVPGHGLEVALAPGVACKLPVHARQFRRRTGAMRRKQFERLFQVLKGRSEEHTSELQSLMRISYAVFCLKKKKKRDK